MTGGDIVESAALPFFLSIPEESARAERILFAFRIPHLPDQMMSPHLVGQTERERLAEVLDRQAALTANLGKWRRQGRVALALRFWSRPARQQVELFMVAAVVAPWGQGVSLAATVGQDLTALLASFEYPVEPLVTEGDLKGLLFGLSAPHVVELRQREEIISMIRGDAYVVLPFQPPMSTLIPTFDTLLRQPDDCQVNIYLEPTVLRREEHQSFSEAAAIAATYADFQNDGYYFKNKETDPAARLVARLYQDYLYRLNDPFQMAIQVASPNLDVARSVAQALGAELTEAVGPQQVLRDENRLPSGFEVIIAESPQQQHSARQIFHYLNFLPWAPTLASPGKERLAHLFDARTAAAAFRFPVPIKGGIPGVKSKQVLPSYEVGMREQEVPPGHILLGHFSDRGGIANAEINKFTKHLLVVGTTGSGKTTTNIHILTQLWERNIPFLVIEPAKTEYRALLGSPIASDLKLFTLGDESVSAFRLNPLEVLPGVRVESHLSQLKACIGASMPAFGVLPSLIEEALERAYLNRGWNLTDKGTVDDSRLMPTIGEFYFEMIQAVERRGYSDKTQMDIRAAAAGRIGSLLRGSKGRMLNTRRSIPFGELMAGPAILELEPLNDEEKSLVMLCLLTLVREHCMTTRSTSKLQHITLLEEAHRILAKVGRANAEVEGNSKAEAVTAMCAMLSEVRSLGEGMIIADQIPGRLAEDALKNTNIKIVHRLPGQDDRLAVGGTMNLGEEQEPYLSKLAPGQAAFFIEGYEKPTFIQVPDYRSQNDLPERMPESQVEAHMAPFRAAHPETFLPFPGCVHCQRQCQHRDRVGNAVYTLEAHRAFRNALYTFERLHPMDDSAAWHGLISHCQQAMRAAGLGADPHAVYCYFVHHYGDKTSAKAANRIRGQV